MTDKNNPLQFATAFEWIGGAQQVQALTTRFYDLMALEPQFAALRAVHSPDLSSARDKLYLFLTGWLGGPQLYIEQHGHPRLRQRHMGFKIGVTERDQWVACMAQAMRDIGVADDLFALTWFGVRTEFSPLSASQHQCHLGQLRGFAGARFAADDDHLVGLHGRHDFLTSGRDGQRFWKFNLMGNGRGQNRH